MASAVRPLVALTRPWLAVWKLSRAGLPFGASLVAPTVMVVSMRVPDRGEAGGAITICVRWFLL